MAASAGLPPVAPLATYEALTAALVLPGRRLIFCDETSLQGKAAPPLEPDIEVMCAVCLSSDDYLQVSATIAQRLQALDVPEFHATELVNPNTASAWSKVALAERLAAFRLISRLLRDHVRQAGYLFIARADFERMDRTAGAAKGLGIGQKAALRKVTLRCAAERFAADQTPTVLVVDQVKASATPRLARALPGLVGGGAIAADSARIAGLQLADMAVYCLGRFVRKRAALAAGQGGPFDQIALETIADFHGRMTFFLSPGDPTFEP